MYFDIQKGLFLGRASDPTSTPNRRVPLTTSSSLKNMLRRTCKLLMIDFCSRHYGTATAIYFAMQSMVVEFLFYVKKGSKSFPAPMVHRAAPISVSIALGHASANAVKATAGGAGPLVAPRV